jgi:hypothetical protein
VAIDDAIYTIGDEAYRYQEGAWTNLDKGYITRSLASGIDGRRPDNIYAVGSQMILRYNGAAWEWVNGGLGEDLYAVWVEPNDHVVAVGSGPVIVEYDGATWTKREVPLDSYAFLDVTGVGNTIFAVGAGGLVAIRKQGHWYLMRPTGWTLRAVWGYDEQHVYAVSENDNEICFYDGNRWEPFTIEGPTLRSMTSIWGTSSKNIFVLDDNGTLAHFDGSTWAAQERQFCSGMSALAGTRRELLAAGRNGASVYRK